MTDQTDRSAAGRGVLRGAGGDLVVGMVLRSACRAVGSRRRILPVRFGQFRTAKRLPVLAMASGYSRWLSAGRPSTTATDRDQPRCSAHLIRWQGNPAFRSLSDREPDWCGGAGAWACVRHVLVPVVAAGGLPAALGTVVHDAAPCAHRAHFDTPKAFAFVVCCSYAALSRPRIKHRPATLRAAGGRGGAGLNQPGCPGAAEAGGLRSGDRQCVRAATGLPWERS